MLPATALIVVAGVRLLKNPCFRNSFTSIFGSHWRCCLRLRSIVVAGVRLLQNQCVSICFINILALTKESWLLECVCVKIHSFLLVLQTCWLSLEVLPATAFIVVAGVRLLHNHYFFIGFTIILALTRGAACDCVHRGCCCAFASKSTRVL